MRGTIIYQDGKKRLEDKEGYEKKKEENGRRME
jgi:hypothetical protein